MYPRTTDMEEMRHRCRPLTGAFYDYWDSKRQCADGSRVLMPAPSALDLREMKSWLPYLQLIDVFHDPRRLVYRLVGQADVIFRGENPTGRSVEENFIGFNAEETRRNYELVVDHHLGVYDWSEHTARLGYLGPQETLLLPLSDDGEIVNMVVTFALLTD